MHEDANGSDGRVLTDHEQIRKLAEAHDAVPTVVERPGTDDELGIRTAPEDSRGEPVTWGSFFERLERNDRVVRYRTDPLERGDPVDFQVLDRGSAVDRDSGAGVTDEPADVESEQLATSDTGEEEPVAFDRTESESAGEEDVEEAATAPTHDTERAPTDVEAGLIVDEVHEGPAWPDEWERSNEYLVFRNVGDEPLDLSGWTVENESGRAYRFPPGTELDPGARLTLHSGDGTDTDDELYWNADGPVWGNKRDTIVVEDATGRRVIREPYEA